MAIKDARVFSLGLIGHLLMTKCHGRNLVRLEVLVALGTVKE